MSQYKIDRREFIRLTTLGSIVISSPLLAAARQTIPKRIIPSTGERLPVIGLGTSDEFEDLPAEGTELLKSVIRALVDAGGTMIDTAPSYGNAESVLGRLYSELQLQDKLFIATKVSPRGSRRSMKQAGLNQMAQSENLLGKKPLDLILVHNLYDLDTQWQNLLEWEAAGRVRYIGVSVSRYTLFARLEQFMRNASGIDFVQLNYSMMEPLADEVLIPLAVDKGIGVIVNRPFGNGDYFSGLRGKELPAWSQEFDCESWAQFSLKWILANEHITCVIPATSTPRHMLDNARAGLGRLPNQDHRRRMTELIQSAMDPARFGYGR